MHLLLAGGGTAGHVAPALAVADAARRLAPDTAVTALGTPRGLETRLVPERGYPLELIPPVPLPRRPGPDLLRLPLRLGQAVRAVDRVIRRTGTDVLVGFGGYVAMPAYLAARRRRVPIVVHEQNAVPGLANRVGARLTRHVLVAFPGTPLPHADPIGLPMRPAIAGLDRVGARATARESFGLDPQRPTLLVTGGSQGARRLNEAAAAAAPKLAAAGVQVLHLTGARGGVAWKPGAGDPPYLVVPYVDRMDLAYAAADLAVCRAGAGTVAEMAAVGLPAVFVPFPHGNGEQERNAAPVVAAGGGLLVPDRSLTAEWLATAVPDLLADRARLAAMATAAADLLPRDADRRLAELALDLARAR